MTDTRTGTTALLPRRPGLPEGDSPAGDLAAQLGELGARRATGALEGDAGTLYLTDGMITGAQSRLAVDSEPAGGGSAVELRRLTAFLDAAFFACSGGTEALRFLDGVPSPVPPAVSLPARVFHRTITRRRALLQQIWPWPAVDLSAVRPRPEACAEGLGRCPDSWRGVVQAADGRRTPPEIARLLARSAFSTVLDVRRMAAAGLIETPGLVAGSAPGTVPGTASGTAAGTTAGVPVRADPTAHMPAEARPAGARRPSPPGPVGSGAFADPTAALLLRLRVALEERL